jgi:hypothetical protein
MTEASTPRQYELSFRPLSEGGNAYAFPCDASGRVDLDGLTERARTNYLFARAMVGWALAPPAVRVCSMG